MNIMLRAVSVLQSDLQREAKKKFIANPEKVSSIRIEDCNSSS
jgi:hypothetical protein